MSLVTVRQCNLCDLRNHDDSPMFVAFGEVDVCVSCLDRLKRASEYGLFIPDLVMASAIAAYDKWREECRTRDALASR